ncbi:MAG: glycosyltransferase [Planctomycetota bacterium]|nr:MAG: glycosyltransferase [Planctomycetota bacterium]
MPDAIPPVPEAPKIAVLIPSFRVKQHILGVLAKIGPECAAIYVVDDACPEGSGAYVEAECKDPRVRVLRHEVNQGVGGATMTGYRAALEDGARILVKLDGDGQMDPALIPRLVAPILAGEADYAKGNRFFELEGLSSMPKYRLLGNSALSFMNKLSSGYWDIFDPTNGFTALHAAVAAQLPWDRLSRRYFFESDLLFRLATLRAVVVDVPMPAVYGDETSGIVLRHAVGEFAWGHLRNTVKRIFYNYYLRDFNIASIEILVGLAFVVFGVTFGAVRWIQGGASGIPSTTGTVMLAALPIILGTQFLLGFVTHDLSSMPRQVIHRRLEPPLPTR